MRLENWSIQYTRTMSMGYSAPEDIPQVACGNVYGNPNFPDGSPVRTSTIQEINLDDGYIKTRNSTYELGVIDALYLEHCRELKRKYVTQLERYINKEASTNE